MPSALDLWLVVALGFLGSFGHCVGMCGPITAAFALSVESRPAESQPAESQPIESRSAESQLTESQPIESRPADAQTVNAQIVNAQTLDSQPIAASIWFHLWLNFGRIVSYALVGAVIGALSSVLFAGGQMAGVGSELRRIISMTTGLLLVWFGLSQAQPKLLPKLPFLDWGRGIHASVSNFMLRVSGNRTSTAHALRPLLLGLLWGLIPCGFLYAGQLRAAETQSWLGGMSIMLAFGIGTMPAMLTTGVTTALMSQDRRSQLFRAGGWLTMVIGVLLLVRTGDTMSDYSGHGALLCLILALVARPISRVWAGLLHYRRGLGVGAFTLSLLHVLHMLSHTWNWKLAAIAFMLPSHRQGIGLGIGATVLMLPAALTSFDQAQRALGPSWRKLHLLSMPALLLAATHTILVGSHYWGAMALGWDNQIRVLGLLTVVGLVFGLRSPRLWSLFSLSHRYASLQQSPKVAPMAVDSCCDTGASSDISPGTSSDISPGTSSGGAQSSSIQSSGIQSS